MPDGSSELLWASGAFVAGVILTTVVQNLVARWWRRARPRSTILNVEIGPKPGTEMLRLSIDYPFILSAKESPILPNLEPQMTIKDLRTYLETARGAVEGYRTIMAHIAQMAGRPRILDPGLTADRQRIQILEEWATFPEADVLAMSAIRRFAEEVPSVYGQPHPTDWRDPQRTTVRLANRMYNLREIDVERELASEIAVQGPVGVADDLRHGLQAANVLRRFWILLRENDLLWLFNKTLEMGRMYEQDAISVVESLESLIKASGKDYLRAEALLTNDGDRSIAVRPDANLAIANPDGPDRPDIHLPMKLTDPKSQGEVQIVQGNRAEYLLFCSERPVSEITVTGKSGAVLLTGARLEALCHAEVLSCRVGIALAGFGLPERSVAVSEPYRFGTKAQERERQEIALVMEKR